jgi:hypothetical protein
MSQFRHLRIYQLHSETGNIRVDGLDNVSYTINAAMPLEAGVSTTIDKVKASPKVASVYGDSDGLWAHLKPGWTCISSGAHSCREDSAAALLVAVSSATECDCDDCRRTP